MSRSRRVFWTSRDDEEDIGDDSTSNSGISGADLIKQARLACQQAASSLPDDELSEEFNGAAVVRQ